MTNNNNPFCSRNRHLGPSTSDLMKTERNNRIAKRNLRYFKKVDPDRYSYEIKDIEKFFRSAPHSIFHKDYFPTKKGEKK